MSARLFVFSFLFAVTTFAPATAETSSPPPAANATNSEKKVCQDIITTGSRLASKRFCGTKAEWEDRRQQDKDAVNQIQTRLNGPCSTINQHSGTPSC
jgi:hypothetical protein